MTNKIPELADIALDLIGPDWDIIRKWCENSDEISDSLAIALENSALAQVMRDVLIEEADIDESESVAVQPEKPVERPLSVPAKLINMARNFHQLGDIQKESFPRPGQLVVIGSFESPDPNIEVIVNINRRPVVLLSEPTEDEGIWAGWVVAPENEKYYSSVWDVHLDEHDRPYLDSMAGVVQVWNPVQVHVPLIKSVIGKLSKEKLAAIHELQLVMLAMGFEYEASSTIGVTEQLEVAGVNLTIGTPLVSESDIRSHYQEIYSEIGSAINQPALIATQLAADVVVAPVAVGAKVEPATVTLPALLGSIMDSFQVAKEQIATWVDRAKNIGANTLDVFLVPEPATRAAADGSDIIKGAMTLGEDKEVEVLFEYSSSQLKVVIKRNRDVDVEVSVQDEDGEVIVDSVKRLANLPWEIVIDFPETCTIVVKIDNHVFRIPVTATD